MQGELYQKMAGHPCLWMYSLQVAPEVQRSGLGRHLVTMCELIANKTNMPLFQYQNRWTRVIISIYRRH